VFEKIVGDGRLWIALSAALNRSSAASNCGGLERALSLADVYREPLLWSAADPVRLRALLSSIGRKGDGNIVLMDARKTTRIVHSIEERLISNTAYYSDQQMDEDHAAGDPVWRQGMGFGRAEEGAGIDKGVHLNVYLRKRGKILPVSATYYINLRIAAQNDQELARLFYQIAPCWPGHE
jgi:hypothetical protein